MIYNCKEFYEYKGEREERDFNSYVNDSFEELRNYLSDTEILENMFQYFSVDERAAVLDSIVTDFDLNKVVGNIEEDNDEEEE